MDFEAGIERNDRLMKDIEQNLTNAIEHHNIKLVELLLKSGADLDKVDHSGISPVQRAVWSGNVHTVKLLHKYHANFISNIEIVMEEAEELSYYDVHDYLMQFASDQLMKAIEQGDIKLAEHMLKARVDPKKTRHGSRLLPIQRAVSSGNVRMVKLLQMHGAELLPHIEALMKEAAESSHNDMLEYLIHYTYDYIDENIWKYNRQWDFDSKYNRFIQNISRNQIVPCLYVLLHWGYKYSTQQKHTLFHKAVSDGNIKMMFLLWEFHPQCLQESWVVNGDIPQILKDNSQNRDFTTHLMELRERTPPLKVLCRVIIFHHLVVIQNQK